MVCPLAYRCASPARFELAATRFVAGRSDPLSYGDIRLRQVSILHGVSATRFPGGSVCQFRHASLRRRRESNPDCTSCRTV